MDLYGSGFFGNGYWQMGILLVACQGIDGVMAKGGIAKGGTQA